MAGRIWHRRKVNEYAKAFEDSPGHPLAWISKSRSTRACNGCPVRVSATRQGVIGKNASAAEVAGWKYPLMSRMTSVVLVTNILTLPLVPAVTMAALALTRPSCEVSSAMLGCDSPVGQIVR